MSVTVKVNGTSNSLAHKGNSGIAQSTIPDVCKTPSPGGPIPVPYPVIVSTSGDLVKGTQTVKADGGNMIAIKGSELSRCTGDEPGTAGGVKSSTNMKEASWILYSFDVKFEGKNACRLSDKMMMNHGNAACLGGYFVKPTNLSEADSKLWDECEKQHDKYKATETENASLSSKTSDLRRQLNTAGPPSPGVLTEYCTLLEKRIVLVEKSCEERQTYIDMGCDKFNWKNDTSTEQERRAKHEGQIKQTKGQICNLKDALKRFKP